MKARKKLPRGVYEKVAGTGIFWIHYTDAAGKRHREKAGSLSNAKKLLEVRHTAKLEGKLPESRKKQEPLFDDLIDAAIRYAKAQDSPYHARDVELKLERIRPDFGNRRATSIRRSEIVEWLAEQADENDWRPASRNRYQAAFSLVFRIAVQDNKIPFNPAAGIARLSENNQRVQFLTAGEEKSLIGELEARFPDYVPIVQLAIHTGMRASELLRARVGDYDPKTGKIAVRQTKVRNAPPLRYVPMTPIAIAAYERLAKGCKAGEPLCRQEDGAAMEQMRYWFDPCVDAAGLVNYVWHDSRHTFCSRLVMAGVPLAAVAEFVGHRNITMTMRYAHLQPMNNSQAVNATMSFYESETGEPTATRTATGTQTSFQQGAISL